MKILDIWAIINEPQQLFTALSKIFSNDTIVFENIKTKLKINGETILYSPFDTMIYSENSDCLILLKRSGKANVNQVYDYLDNKNLSYNTVSFIETTSEINNDNCPEFWFARDPYVIKDACDDSLKKGYTNCAFSKNTDSALKIFYYDKNNKQQLLQTILFESIIKFDDKIILPMKNFENQLFTDLTILEILENKNLNVKIDYDQTVAHELINKYKLYTKNIVNEDENLYNY